MPDFDLTTRLGRVQAAWWLRDRGVAGDVLAPEERSAYKCALSGWDNCDQDHLRSLLERYREDK